MWILSCTTRFTITWWTTDCWPKTWRMIWPSLRCTTTLGFTSTTIQMGSVYMKQSASPMLIVPDDRNIYSLSRLWRWTVPGSSTLTRWPKTVWCMSLIESSALWATPSRTIWKAMKISPLLLYVKSHLGKWYQTNIMNSWIQCDVSV